jgi:MFS transporter, ACDE family, multidrug resistance protein
MRIPSPAALFGLGGLPLETQRGLVVALSTSVAVIMGVNLLYPVLPPMMLQLGVDESAIGLVVTAYTVPMIFVAPLAGAWADLRGRRPVLFVGMLIFGIAGALIGLAPNFEAVLALRVVQGIGAGLITPLTIVLLSDLLEGERETSAQGLKVVLDRVGISVIPLLAGLLALVSWSLPFFLFALAVPIAFLGMLWLPEFKQHEKKRGARAYLGGFGEVWRRPRLLIAFTAGSLRFFLDYGYFTYLPIYLALSRGTSSAVSGLLFGCFAAGAMVTASQAGRLARGRDPARLVFVGFVLSGISVALIPMLPNDWLVGLSMAIYGLGNGIISPLQKSLLMGNAPRDIRAGVVSLDRLFQQIAKSAAPTAMGVLLVVASVESIFWVLGALSFGSVALAAILLSRQRRAQPAVEAAA